MMISPGAIFVPLLKQISSARLLVSGSRDAQRGMKELRLCFHRQES